MYPSIYIYALDLELPTYGLCALVGAVIMLVLLLQFRKSTILSEDNMLDGIIFALIFGMLGAKVLYLITEPPILPLTWEDIKELLTTGLVFYGGLLGGLIGLGVASLKTKKPYLTFTDNVLPAFCFAHACGRVGCLMAGCCYGVEMEGAFCLQLGGTSRLAVQLLEAFFLVLLGLFLSLLRKKKPRRGVLSGLYMVFYAIWRFIIEFWRDDDRGLVGALSTSQFIGLFVFAAGILILFLSKKYALPVDFITPAPKDKAKEPEENTEVPMVETELKDMPALIAHIERLSPEERLSALREKAKTLLPALAKKTGEANKAKELFTLFVLGALYSDGRLEEAEFTLLQPNLASFFGEEADIAACRERLLAAGDKAELLKNNADLLIDLIGEDDPALKNDCVLTSLLLCAADGKVNEQEQSYIAELLA